jgi:Na+-driven multidrug efflux pump
LSRRYDPITGDVVPVFFHYAIPSVIGMLAATSAGVIDGIFIGNFVGAPALAAVNISMPAFYLFVAVVFMLAVGGSVMCGKFLGEQDIEAASSIFSKTLFAAIAVSGFVAGVSLFLLDEIVALLGANDDLHQMVRDYMQIILWAAPLLIIALTLDYFVRVDGRPVLASAALVSYAAINIALDWVFIVHWGWGIKGAAWATAFSEGVILIILAGHFASTRSTLKLVRVPNRWRNGWDSVYRAAYNGFSEFANEMSLGLITLLFNWVMISRLGVEGVAAFTIIGYLLMIGLEVCYGVSDSLQPAVSKNLGARQPRRIVRFTVTAVTTNFFIGLTVSALFILQPDALVSLFLSEGESGTEAIALSFIAVFWPAFLFNGVNITLASYLTALHKPLQSAAIAISRSLVLPALGLLLLPRWLGDTGIFIAVPVAELLTLALGLILVAMNRPSAIVAALGPGQKSPLN